MQCGTCSCVARPPPNIGEHRKGSMLAWRSSVGFELTWRLAGSSVCGGRSAPNDGVPYQELVADKHDRKGD
jgi:hypothetical protein